jgi:hypothetical protein
MHKFLAALFAVLAVGFLSSCTQAPQAPDSKKVSVADPKEKGPVGPYCIIERARRHQMGGESQIRTWDLRAHGVKELTIRILAIENGKSTAEPWRIKHSWTDTKWTKDTPEWTDTLVLLVYRQKNKLFPALNTEMNLRDNGTPPKDSSQSAASSDYYLENHFGLYYDLDERGPLAKWVTLAAHTTGQKQKDGGMGFSRPHKLEDLIVQTEGGGATLALTLEWTAD